MPICGYKLSICCSLLSIFALVMLSILGLLLYVESVTFAEDLGLEGKHFENLDDLLAMAKVKYGNAVKKN